jgi:hypothetical protein
MNRVWAQPPASAAPLPFSSDGAEGRGRGEGRNRKELSAEERAEREPSAEQRIVRAARIYKTTTKREQTAKDDIQAARMAIKQLKKMAPFRFSPLSFRASFVGRDSMIATLKEYIATPQSTMLPRARGRIKGSPPRSFGH